MNFLTVQIIRMKSKHKVMQICKSYICEDCSYH